MSLIRMLTRWFSTEQDGCERRPEAGFPGVEQLESRLCLGSMQAATVADWAAASPASEMSARTSLAAESQLLDDVLMRERETLPPAPGDLSSPQSSARGETESGPPRPFEEAREALPLLPTGLGNTLDNHAWETDGSTESSVRESDVANRVRAAGTGVPKILASTLPLDGANDPSETTVHSDNSASSRFSPANATSQFAARDAGHQWSGEALQALGLRLNAKGDAIGILEQSGADAGYPAWWTSTAEPVVIGYDFRNIAGSENVIDAAQRELAVAALNRWSEATEGKLVFQRDTESDASRIINIGAGDMSAFGHVSGEGGLLGLGGGRITMENDQFVVGGVAWLDQYEQWDHQIGNGNPEGTVDFHTVVSHELGHTLGYGDTASRRDDDIMDGAYRGERSLNAVENAVSNGHFYRTVESVSADDGEYEMQAMTVAMAQLKDTEVEQLLERASRATASSDAIIAIVDRNGRVLGVRVEADVLATITDSDTLVFAIDGAIAKARTAALFSNGNPDVGTLAPLTSRTVRFLSQSTVTQREVESNPNVDGASAATANASTTRGPGFVAPVGAGGHFPPDVPFTPPVDLFAIEHTNRDSTMHPGPDGVKGTADDITLRGRFNIDPAHVPVGNELAAPESYGNIQNSGLLPDAQSRGIATLPGGIPLFRDTNGDGVGETLVGGIGVFFPGADGSATFEQGFVPGVGQSTFARTNASKVLEAEYIAFAAAGGSLLAETQFGVAGAKIGAIGGVAPVTGLDVPFGRLDLVGIQLEVIGPIAGKEGLKQVLAYGASLGEGGDSGADQPLIGGTLGLYRDGKIAPGDDTAGGVFLVNPHSSSDMTAAEVNQIITQGLVAANEVRAAVRLPLGSRTKMVFAVTDTTGEVLGLYRMQDATTFSIDVAVAKARNVAYYADPTILQPEDEVPGVAPGTAFTNRTFRFLSEPRFPSGIDGIVPDFSILNDGDIDNSTAENNGSPDRVDEFRSVLGNDAFFPMSNFRDPGDAGVVAAGGADQTRANQSGVVFFPGSTPLYRDGVLIGGLGVSGDGVDQDDVVTNVAATGFQAFGNATRADETLRLGVRLPFQKFLRNPWG